MNKKAILGLNTTIIFIVGILILSVMAFVIVMVVSVFPEVPTLNTETASTSQSILANSSATLSPIGEGITSSSGLSANQTWLEFDGDDDEVDLDYDDSWNVSKGLDVTNFSISIWAKSDLATQTANTYLYRTSGDNLGLAVGSDNIRCIYQNQSGDTSGTNGEAISLSSNWTNYMCIMNGTSTGLYLNGILLDLESGDGTVLGLTDSEVLRIGFEGGADRYWNGSIDNFRFYNKSLSISESYSISLNRDYILDKHYTINKTFSTTNYKGVNINSSGALFRATNDKAINVSIDEGDTFTEYCFNCSDSPEIFFSSKDIGYSSYRGNFTIIYGKDNFTSLEVFECHDGALINSSLRHQGMSEDSLGNLYLGEYTVSSQQGCAIVYKSEDEGLTWTKILNASEYGTNPSKHTHLVAVDPYTDYIYVSTGEATNGAKLLRSKDYGVSWTLLGEANHRWQPIVAEFSPDHIFFGADSGSTLAINRFDKSTDIMEDFNVSEEYTLTSMHSSLKIDDNTYLFGTQAKNKTYNAVMLYTENSGDDWYYVYRLNKSLGSNSGVFTQMSKADNEGYVYVRQPLTTERFSITSIEPVIKLNFNENSGLTAHDVSGNSNDGTIDGATWNRSDENVTLVQDTDYSISGNTLTILNDNFQWRGIYLSWNYDVRQSGVNSIANNISTGVASFFGNTTTWFSLLAIVVILLIIAIIIFSVKKFNNTPFNQVNSVGPGL